MQWELGFTLKGLWLQKYFGLYKSMIVWRLRPCVDCQMDLQHVKPSCHFEGQDQNVDSQVNHAYPIVMVVRRPHWLVETYRLPNRYAMLTCQHMPSRLVGKDRLLMQTKHQGHFDCSCHGGNTCPLVDTARWSFKTNWMHIHSGQLAMPTVNQSMGHAGKSELVARLLYY